MSRAGERAPVAGSKLTLSSPQRLVIERPPLTKLALAQFYVDIRAHVLPGLVNRPLSLVRCPGGAARVCFYQKHPGPGTPDAVRRVRLREKEGYGTYAWIDDLDGLVGLVQINALEIHPWGSTTRAPETPDRLVMDLDPAPDVPFARVVEGARALRERLRADGLEGFVRTTGGKGLHVVAPIARPASWTRLKAYAESLARTLAREAPDRYVDVASKARRGGLIYVDYLRNARGQTAVASYTLRARDGAPVATPLRWDELDTLRSGADFNVANLRERLAVLRGEPWAGLADAAAPLPRGKTPR